MRRRAHGAETGVSSLPIVPDLNVLEDCSSGLRMRIPVAVFDQLPLQGGEEALRYGIVVRIALPAHAARDPVLAQQRLVLARGILRPAVRMVQQTSFRLSPPESHRQGIGGEGCFPAGRTESAVQWLSDNGSIYTALETRIHAERLGLVPVTTPARSPQSNGMSEAFVNTMRRDYIESAELWSAAHVIAQLPEWFEDYNENAPHSALGMKSPREYRLEKTLSASL